MQDDRASKIYLERIRALSMEERLMQARALYWSARELKAAHLRSIHPEWSDAQIAEAVRDAFMYASE